MLDLLVVFTSVVVNFFLGLAVFIRNPKGRINRLFALFSTSVILWTLSNYFADFANSQNLLYTRLAFVFAAFIALSLYLISNFFPVDRALNRLGLIKFEIGFSVFVAILSLTPLLVPSVEKIGNTVELTVAPAYYIYIVLMVQLLALVIYNFQKRYRHSAPQVKSQIALLLTGIVTYAVLALASNLILPLYIDNWSTSRIGPLFTVLFVAAVGYAIVKHRFLDIRLIVARSLAYVLLVAALAGIYIGVIIVPTVYILPEDATTLRNIIPFVSALFVAATAPFLKRFFDKFTNEFFYQDAYDPQAFINELNQAIVANIEIGILLRHVAKTIEDNLKCQYCLIAIKDSETGKLKIRNESEVKISSDALEEIKQELIKRGQAIAVSDEMDVSEGELKKLLTDNNIAIVRPLLEEYYQTQEALAYMILGPKKSGNIYSKQDLRIIDIISDELLIATQNALRFEEIQEFNVVLQERIEEATAKLRRTNQKLKELDDTKDEFISMASHQLRTPLTSVKGYVSMVLEGDAGKISPTQRQLLNQAFTSSQRMVYLIADLLNVSRLKTGKFVINQVESYLPDVVQSEMDQLKEAFANKNLRVTFSKPKDYPTLLLDETKIRQVIMNFIDNAVYYTPKGGKITVELKQDKKHTYFTVKDSGLGVPKAEQAHLFTKFYRASNARKARPDGSGLGLFMAKKVVVAQGGNILFESQEGKGSTFGFCFETANLLPKTKEVVEKEEVATAKA